jgi:hypothetical protein
MDMFREAPPWPIAVSGLELGSATRGKGFLRG